MRKCLCCGSEDVVTPLLGMFALALCPEHREIVARRHRAAREEAELSGACAPLLSEEFARQAVAESVNN